MKKDFNSPKDTQCESTQPFSLHPFLGFRAGGENGSS